MIPVITGEPTATPAVMDWEDTFSGVQVFDFDGDGTFDDEVPVTHRIYWMMPDRPDGYARFEEAANGFGGPGALYNPASDGDNQVDLNPATGAPCDNQGAYIDYCYKGEGSYVYPIGRMLVGDLAGDGTTPPAGTTVRILTTKPAVIANEPQGPVHTEAYALLPAYPNPLSRRAVVPFEVRAAGRVRVAVYDLLGREVAVLADGPVSAGRHEAAFEARGLASGVYVVTLEAAGALEARRKVLVVR